MGMVLNASAHGSTGPIQAGWVLSAVSYTARHAATARYAADQRSFSQYIFSEVANWIP
jgi:hypothetical protein